jgi:translation initiation factor 3 subunit F
MIDRVLVYVRSVLSGEVEGDPAIGRYLMDTLGTSTEGLEKGGFNANLQVCVKKCLYRQRLRLMRSRIH